MFCRKCGNQMLDTDRYCLRSGFDNFSNISSGQKDCNACEHTYSMFDERCVKCKGNSITNTNPYRQSTYEIHHPSHSTNPISVIALIIAIGIGVSMMISLADDFSRFGGNGGIVQKNYNYSMTNNNVEITLEEFYKIKNGMTYEEVKNIIGSSGTLTQETDYMGIKSHMITYEGRSVGSNAIIMFENGKVISKTQVGLD